MVQFTTKTGTKGAIALPQGVSTVTIHWEGKAKFIIRVNGNQQAIMEPAETRKTVMLTAKDPNSRLDMQINGAEQADLIPQAAIQIVTVPMADQ